MVSVNSINKICISIAEDSAEKCLNALKDLEFAEIRLDKMKLNDRDIRQIFSQPLKLIATCRPNAKDEKERMRLLLKAIESGASFVDIEVDANEEYKKELTACAKMHNCKIIVSYHNYKKTPPSGELEQIVKWCFESGADIAKIACMVNSENDNARLLGLLDSDKKIIVVGMGEKGKITRIVAPLLGSVFTFASISKGKDTADGQIEKNKLEQILKILGEEENV